MRRTICWILALLLASLSLPAFAGGAPETDDPVVVSVGDVAYPLSTVQASFNDMFDLYVLYGMTLSDAQRIALRDAVVERFVITGVLENKLREEGLDGLSEMEEQTLREAARTRYDEIWLAFAEQVRAVDAGAKDADITAYLASQGCTLDTVYDEALAMLKNQRMIERYCQGVTVTEEQVAAYYEEQYVSPFRERYANDIPRYETEIVAKGNESFYAPSGYRRVKQILLPVPDDITLSLSDIETEMEAVEARAQTAYEALAAQAAAGEDPKEEREKYNAALAEYDALEAAYLAVRDEILPALSETTDAIFSALDAGEPFESLMALYSVDDLQAPSDPGYLFHADSQMWAQPFHDAAASLAKPGDVSAPVLTGSGVHILLYAADEPSGAHALTDAEAVLMRQAALENAQLTALERMADAWRAAYPITTDASLLTFAP